jgi:hypothetical protein
LNSAKDYTDELPELTPEDKLELKASFDELTTDTAQTPLAATRVKRIMSRMAPAVWETLQKIVVEFATEASKKLLGIS